MSVNFFKKRLLETKREIIFEGDSSLNHITIIEEDGNRTMYLGPLSAEAETSIDIRNPGKAVFEYPGMMLSSLIFNSLGGKIVMLGLGGGFLPGLVQKHLPQFELQVVEIDGLVAELAEIYFNFKPGGNVSLTIADGRQFIESLAGSSCDYIWLDAFDGDYIPQRLMSLTFLQCCREALKDTGFLAQNLHQSRPYTCNRQVRTTFEVFGEPILLSGTRSGNLVAINPKEPNSWPQSHLKRLARKFSGKIGPYDLSAEIDKRTPFRLEPSARIIYEDN